MLKAETANERMVNFRNIEGSGFASAACVFSGSEGSGRLWRQVAKGGKAVTGHRTPNDGRGGFTRLDLLAVLAGGMLVAGLLGFQLLGERGRTARCARNLAALGQAMQGFAADHDGALPPAAVTTKGISWSFLIAPYIHGAPALSNSPTARWEWEEAVRDRLTCPSDKLLRGYPRSYAMSAHDMRPENWPPNGEENCGVGLQWNPPAMKKLLEKPITDTNPTDVTGLAWIKPGALPDPANTLLLTELIHPGNKLKDVLMASFRGPKEQVDGVRKMGGPIHGGRFNYLMVDGHVELLRPYQPDVFTENAGIWTMKEGD